MKRFGKILFVTLILLIVLLAVGITLTIGWRPFIGPKARPLTSKQFERTPQRLERGRYLFTGGAGPVFSVITPRRTATARMTTTRTPGAWAARGCGEGAATT